MRAEKNKKTPVKRRKYDDAFKAQALRLASENRSTQAAAQQLGSSRRLLYRWQEAKLVAEVGSVEVARDSEVRQLRAQLKRAEQEVDILKKALVSKCFTRIITQPTRGASIATIAQRRDQVSVRQLCQVLRVAPSAYYAWQRRQLRASEPAWQVAV